MVEVNWSKKKLNLLTSVGSKRSYIPKQTPREKLLVCLSMCDIKNAIKDTLKSDLF